MLNTSPQGKQPKSLGSTSGRSDAGTNRGKSKRSGQREGKDDTTWKGMQLELNLDWTPESISSMPELAPAQPDLDRQIEYLTARYPDGEVVSEIGGGLNFKRKKILAVLERIMSGDVKRLVVAHKDRLARFGFDLFRWLCEQNGCELVVLNESSLSPSEEMVEDILAILHCFSSRLYGLRKYKAQMQEDSDLPKRET